MGSLKDRKDKKSKKNDTKDQHVVLLANDERLSSPRMTESLFERAVISVSIGMVIIIIIQFLILLWLGIVTYSLYHEESTIIHNAVDILKQEVYPDVLLTIQHKMGHIDCLVDQLTTTLGCACKNVLVDHLGVPMEVCDIYNGTCGFGGISGLADTCELKHIFEVSTSELVSYVEDFTSH